MKKNWIVFLGIGLIILTFGGLSFYIAALTGDLWGKLPKAIMLISLLFVVPVVLVFLFSLFRVTPAITVVSYFAGFFISDFIYDVCGVAEGDSWIYGFFISISCGLLVNKLISLLKELNELRNYKSTVDPYFEFFKERAEEANMTAYDYLQCCKKATEKK